MGGFHPAEVFHPVEVWQVEKGELISIDYPFPHQIPHATLTFFLEGPPTLQSSFSETTEILGKMGESVQIGSPPSDNGIIHSRHFLTQV